MILNIPHTIPQMILTIPTQMILIIPTQMILTIPQMILIFPTQLRLPRRGLQESAQRRM
jgi:hypothetical protein